VCHLCTVLAVILCCVATASAAGGPSAKEAHEFAAALARRGPRPAASKAERDAQQRVAARFRAAGLRVAYDRFGVPGKGRSRNVTGIRDSPASCLTIVMAHADSVPPAPGANDNASGVGALVALARALGRAPAPACDAWLVATGAEERPYTGQRDHLGAEALARRLERMSRARDVRYALSLDEVGRGTRFDLHSTAAAPTAADRAILRHSSVRWVRDPLGEGNSDHRELARHGMPASKLGAQSEPCRHTACDTADRLQRAAFARALRIVWPVLHTSAA
jgi:hypothetical protein